MIQMLSLAQKTFHTLEKLVNAIIFSSNRDNLVHEDGEVDARCQKSRFQIDIICPDTIVCTTTVSNYMHTGLVKKSYPTA